MTELELMNMRQFSKMKSLGIIDDHDHNMFTEFAGAVKLLRMSSIIRRMEENNGIHNILSFSGEINKPGTMSTVIHTEEELAALTLFIRPFYLVELINLMRIKNRLCQIFNDKDIKNKFAETQSLWKDGNTQQCLKFLITDDKPVSFNDLFECWLYGGIFHFGYEGRNGDDNTKRLKWLNMEQEMSPFMARAFIIDHLVNMSKIILYFNSIIVDLLKYHNIDGRLTKPRPRLDIPLHEYV